MGANAQADTLAMPATPRNRFLMLALGPPLALLAVLSLPPTVGALLLALRNQTLMSPNSHWVGVANFARMLTDHRLHNALWISLVWEMVTVAGSMVVAVLLGIVLFERITGPARDWISLALILPILLPRVSAGLIWRFMYSPLMGIMNYPLQVVGLPPIEYLSQPSMALYAVAVVDIWQWGLFFGVIMMKLLETLPTSPLEAARLDHASTFGIHWFVTLPMLRASLITMLFVKAVESLRSFDLIYTMTNGGPGIATETLDLYAYQTGIGMSGAYLVCCGHECSSAGRVDNRFLCPVEVVATVVGLTRRISNALTIVVLLFVTLFPVLWTLLGSFKTLREIVTPVPVIFFHPTLKNYVDVLAIPSAQHGLENSAIVVGCSLAIGMLLGIPAAHALVRYAPRLKGDVLFYVLSLRFMPPVAIAIPFIVIYSGLGINDTRFSLILTYCLTTISTIIWLGVPAFEQVPREIEEAASLEGYSQFEVFLKVALPVAVPSLVGAILFTFIIVWNELLIALSLTSQNFTLPVVAASFTTMGMEVPWGIINASTILLALPPFLFIGAIMRFLNRFFRLAAN